MDILSDKQARYHTWIRKGNLQREIGSLLIAAQNNTVRTNDIKTKIDKTQQKNSDRNETDNHIISEFSKFAQKEYKTRHDGGG